MPKLKHIIRHPKKIFDVPASVLNKVGEAGIFGQRGDKFRVLGIPIGKDLQPVVKGAAIIGAAVVGGPALASAAGMSLTAATVVVSAAASGTVTGLSGGDTKQVMTATAVGAGTGLVGGVAQAMPTMAGTVATHVAGNTVVGVAAGGDLDSSLIRSVVTAPIALAPNNITVACTSNAVAGAVADPDHPLRGAAQNVALTGIGHEINNMANRETQSVPNSEPNSVPNSVQNSSPNSVPNSTPNNVPNSVPNTESNSIPNNETNNSNSVRSSVNVRPTGLSVTVGSNDNPLSATVRNNAAGITARHSETTSSRLNMGRSDIYDNGVMIERQTIVTAGNNGGNNPNVTSFLNDSSVTNPGACFATRTSISNTLTNNLVPTAVTTQSSQLHVNTDCAIAAGGIAAVGVGLVTVPEITLPGLLLNEMANN